MDDRRDELLERAIAELQTLPNASERAVERIVKAAAEARAAEAPMQGATMLTFPARRRMIRLSVAIGWAAAAGLTGFAVRDVIHRSPAVQGPSLAPEVAALRTVSGIEAELAPVATHFVFEYPNARSVAIVGSFNGWDATAPGARLERQAGSPYWSGTLALPPGRHVYAYLINDTLLVLDPRAPSATDPDLGVESSVVIVGKP